MTGKRSAGQVHLGCHTKKLEQDFRGYRKWLKAFDWGEDEDGLYPIVSFRFLGRQGNLEAETIKRKRPRLELKLQSEWGAGSGERRAVCPRVFCRYARHS